MLVTLATHSLPAAGQGMPPSTPPRNTALPSAGSLLQNNPILNAPAEPQGKDEVKVEGQRPAPGPASPADTEAIHVARIEVATYRSASSRKSTRSSPPTTIAT